MKIAAIKALCLVFGIGLCGFSSVIAAETTDTTPATGSVAAVQTATSAEQQDRVNINTATAQELAERLANVGPRRAEAIVNFREEHGPFTHIEQLLDVPGIGAGLLERNQSRLTL